jgi:uncharacterized protein YecE (DUF72 family)
LGAEAGGVDQLPLFEDVAPAVAPERVEPLRVGRCTVSVGTCGYSYREWIGAFYPPRIRSQEMLAWYARFFPTVEIDSTYYGVPTAAKTASMARRTPDGFTFTAKAPGTLTHAPLDAGEPSLADAPLFREGVAPLVAAGKLAVVLLQFPNGFRPGPRAERHLERLREALPGLPLVAEFRHRDWQANPTLELLASLGIGWCNVDEPGFETLLRPAADVVGDVAYVRFHGRNAKTWWKGDAAERYFYSYTAQELQPWVERVADMASASSQAYVFFNNHRFGHAASNAATFAQMLAAATSV